MVHKTANMTTGFLLGIGAGLAAGMLLAPRKGQETREMLMERARKTRNQIKGKAREAQDAAEQVAESAQGLISKGSASGGATRDTGATRNTNSRR